MYEALAVIEERLEAVEIDTRKFLFFFAEEAEAAVSLSVHFLLRS